MSTSEPGRPLPKYAEGISFSVSPHGSQADSISKRTHRPPHASSQSDANSSSMNQPQAPGNTSFRQLASQVGKKSVHGVKKAVNYVPRFSFFEAENEMSVKDPFRGFYVLFWICLGTQVLNAFVRSFENTGQILSMTLAILMSRDLLMLAMSDAVLVGQTFLCVPLVKALYRYKIPRGYGLFSLQMVWYCTIMTAVIVWIRIRDWPWTQSGFFVLHSIVQLMKIHSYVDVNSCMNDGFMKLKTLEKKLMDRVMVVEGKHGALDRNAAWTAAIKSMAENLNMPFALSELKDEARRSPLKEWLQLETQIGASDVRAQKLLTAIRSTIPCSRSPLPEHRRLVDAVTNSKNEHLDVTSVPQAQADLHDVHPLLWHPDPELHEIAREISAEREGLYAQVIPGQGIGPMWPNNVSVANFWDFQLVPSLVYQLQYPRRESIRPWYIVERCIALLGSFLVIYVITVNWIIPVTEEKDASLISVFLQLTAPMMACVRIRVFTQYLLLFYLMFECVCQGFAEITRFADREFYRDWWNSTTMEEFSRDWNRPVHHFLLQHVYVSLIFQVGLNKSTASLVTFLLSSVFHELVMIVVSGKVRGYLFLMQMSQYPLILLGRTKFIKKRPVLGNFFFWLGMMIGFPALNILYLMF